MNESLESLFPVKVDPEKKESKQVSLTRQEQEYVDQEKLIKPEEPETKPVSLTGVELLICIFYLTLYLICQLWALPIQQQIKK